MRHRGSGRGGDAVSAGVHGHHGLTARELQIVGLLMRGHGTEEITRRLHVHPQTVRNSTHRIGVKLGVSGRLKIVARAHDLGIAPAED